MLNGRKTKVWSKWWQNDVFWAKCCFNAVYEKHVKYFRFSHFFGHWLRCFSNEWKAESCSTKPIIYCTFVVSKCLCQKKSYSAAFHLHCFRKAAAGFQQLIFTASWGFICGHGCLVYSNHPSVRPVDAGSFLAVKNPDPIQIKQPQASVRTLRWLLWCCAG